MDHLLSIEELTGPEIAALVERGAELKALRGTPAHPQPLTGQCWALIFRKSSTRTRVSFEVGVRELGGHVMFLSENDIQLGRGEPIEDTARVLGRMVHGAIIRTYDQDEIVRFAKDSRIPTINALTDQEHPCQIIADLLTIKETCGGWDRKKVVFLGDGDCNVAWSWIWAAERLGFDLVVAAPEEFRPDPSRLAGLARTTWEPDAGKAVAGAHALYTDVWVSMGKEEEARERIKVMSPYQVNAGLLADAAKGAVVMHCLPAYREKEITAEVFEAQAEVIFTQAENRLHAQKAVLEAVAAGPSGRSPLS